MYINLVRGWQATCAELINPNEWTWRVMKINSINELNLNHLENIQSNVNGKQVKEPMEIANTFNNLFINVSNNDPK